MRMRRWTDAEEDYLRQYGKTHTARQIAKVLHRTEKAITLRISFLKRNPSKISDTTPKKIPFHTPEIVMQAPARLKISGTVVNIDANGRITIQS